MLYNNGNIDITNAVGTIESIVTRGNVTTVSATAQVKTSNVSGKLGVAQIKEEETDPTVPQHVKNITEEDINRWNNPNIPDTSEFIKNTVDNLVNYYLKSETYSKEEIDALANAITNMGYATEKWVREQNYMPIEDFHEYINYFYYNKTQIDEKLNNLPEPSVPLEFNINANLVEEDGVVSVYTNTGYKVSDKDIRLQDITFSDTYGTNKIVYTEAETIVIYDGSNKIRYSENGIDFEIITLPYACKSMFYNHNSKRIFGLANGYFLYSDDNGKTWYTQQSIYANNVDFISLETFNGTGLIAINKNTKTIQKIRENFSRDGYVNTTIVPEFVTQFNQYQCIWCNSTGTFKYGAGSNEGAFASLSGVTVNMLKTVNSRQMVGLKNSNKIYIIKNLEGVTGNEWIAYTLPDTCTVNDVIFNTYDQTYYIFTDINTYYKTKDFISFDSVEKNGLRGIQGHFTLMGIQMTTTDHDMLLLAPTRTKLENKEQETRRLLDKSRWAGKGLKLTKEGKFDVSVIDEYLGINNNGLFLIKVDGNKLTEDIIESLYVAKAKTIRKSPFEIEDWYWNEGYPYEDVYACIKFRFTEAGSFLDMVTWEDEISVEEGEVGYLFYDQNMTIFKYVKLYNINDLK